MTKMETEPSPWQPSRQWVRVLWDQVLLVLLMLLWGPEQVDPLVPSFLSLAHRLAVRRKEQGMLTLLP